VLWTDFVDGDWWGIFGQIFDSSGSRIGSEFQVNTYVAGAQFGSYVTILSNGNFVVTWHTNAHSSDSGYGTYGQLFDSTGNRIGGEFHVNTYVNDEQSEPSVAALENGEFIVTWSSDLQDGSNYGVYGQLFDSSGNKVGGEFQINTYTTNNQFHPEVVTLSNGNVAVVWHSDGQDGSGYGIYGQILDSSGNKIGDEFQVSSYTSLGQEHSDIAAFDNGNVAVVWHSDGQDGSGYGIYGQILDSSGNKIGDEFQINTYTTNDQRNPRISIFNNGNFVVTWHSDGQDGSGYGVYARIFKIVSCSFNGELCASNIAQTLSYIEDIPKVFEAIEINSLNANITSINATMILSDVVAGALNQDTISNATSIYKPGLGKWSAWGTLDGVNALLSDLTFIPASQYSNNFYISVFIEDQYANMVTDVISVVSRSGRPVVTTASTELTWGVVVGAGVVGVAVPAIGIGGTVMVMKKNGLGCFKGGEVTQEEPYVEMEDQNDKDDRAVLPKGDGVDDDLSPSAGIAPISLVRGGSQIMHAVATKPIEAPKAATAGGSNQTALVHE